MINVLIYSSTVQLFCKDNLLSFFNTNKDINISQIKVPGSIKYSCLVFLEKVLLDSKCDIIALDWFDFKNTLETLDLYEILDTIITRCYNKNCKVIFIINNLKNDINNKDVSKRLNTVKEYANFTDIPLFFLDERSKDLNTQELFRISKTLSNPIGSIQKLPLAYRLINFNSLAVATTGKELKIYGKGVCLGINNITVPITADVSIDDFDVKTLSVGNTQKEYSLNCSCSFKKSIIVSYSKPVEISTVYFLGQINSIYIDGKIITNLESPTVYSKQRSLCDHTLTIKTDLNYVVRDKIFNWFTKDLEKVESCCLQNNKTIKTAIITLSTKERNFNSYKHLQKVAKDWSAELIFFKDINEVFNPQELELLTKNLVGTRDNIINYAAKMFCIYKCLEKYERVLWLDDTCIISPFAPNIFNFVPDDHIGALVIPFESGLEDVYYDYRFLLKEKGYPMSVYINTGVMVIPQIYRDIFSFNNILNHKELFKSSFPTQAWQNYLINLFKCNVYDITVKYNAMPACYHADPCYRETLNLTHFHTSFFKHYITHFTGFHKKREKLYREFLTVVENNTKESITVVIMNYKRSENIINDILPYYDTIPQITQVLVLHCLEETQFNYTSPKVQHIDAVKFNLAHGLFTRFLASLPHIKNKLVLFTDDDVVLTAQLIARLQYTWTTNNIQTAVGNVGRRLYMNANKEYTYINRTYFGDVDILLTSCFLTSIENVKTICKNEIQFRDYGSLTSVKWNGEDIFASLILQYHKEQKCYAVDYPLIELNQGEHQVSAYKMHNVERSNLLNLFMNRYTFNIEPVQL